MCILPILLPAITMFMAGLGATFECDLREIFALCTSTLGQLLLVVDATPVDFVGHAFFHL
jgi:NADH:ubiquinone oxidoreductase subunit 5 (subunit L)/multisubunit Na+/H+ antiporter MnhA subunit